MAIQKKVPSPREVKKTPIVFSSKELEDIKKLQKNISDITFQFGSLNISKMRLSERE